MKISIFWKNTQLHAGLILAASLLVTGCHNSHNMSRLSLVNCCTQPGLRASVTISVCDKVYAEYDFASQNTASFTYVTCADDSYKIFVDYADGRTIRTNIGYTSHMSTVHDTIHIYDSYLSLTSSETL